MNITMNNGRIRHFTFETAVRRQSFGGSIVEGTVSAQGRLGNRGSEADETHVTPAAAISAASCSTSAGLRSVNGGRTGPASWPTIVAPALMMLTA